MPQAMSGLLENWGEQHDKLYSKRAFVHWYVGEGPSEGFFQCARESVESLKRDIQEIFQDAAEESEEGMD